MIHKQAALETAKMVGFSIGAPLVIWALFANFSVTAIVAVAMAGMAVYAIHGFYKFQVSLHNLTEKE